MRYAVKVVETGAVAATAARLATSLGDRMKGLLGTRSLPAGEGLIIRPCTGVHTFFMKYPIDVVFLAGGGRVAAVYHSLKAWRLTAIHPQASEVVELPAGTARDRGITEGLTIGYEEAQETGT